MTSSVSASTVAFSLTLSTEQKNDLNMLFQELIVEMESETPNLQKFKSFLEQKGDINKQDSNCDTLLNMAVKKGHVEIARFLLQQKADLTIGDEDGDLPLHNAVWHKQPQIAEILIVEYNADPTVVDKRHFTPLHQAAFKGLESTVDLLLKNPLTDVNAISDGGYTALHAAAVNNHLSIAEKLLRRGARVNDQDDQGHSALLWASVRNYTDMCRLLLNYKASPIITDAEGKDIYTTALHNENQEVTSILAERLETLKTTDHPRTGTARRRAVVSLGKNPASLNPASRSVPYIANPDKRPALPPKARSLEDLFPLFAYKKSPEEQAKPQTFVIM